MISRRTFIDGLAAGTAGMAISSSAKSYARILGANEVVNFAIIGTNTRGYGHLGGLKRNSDSSRITHICDVDAHILEAFSAKAREELGYAPKAVGDFRRVLDSKDVDAITIATPDHWHTPMAVLALKAGKHVYVEKPPCHNPREGELLILAQQKYGKLVQVGTERRSEWAAINAIKEIHDGRIGRAYYGKAWYVNTRPTMGIGKVVPVPEWLNWDLWQGPAPRGVYKNNIHPYHWHWLRRYGTGEALNNGTHTVDLCRWALGVGYPSRVVAQGGRYQFKDDWQFYDTLVLSFIYPDKMISWESKSDQGMETDGRRTGVLVQGTEGSVIIDGQGYSIYDWKGRMTYSAGKIEGLRPALNHHDNYPGGCDSTCAHFKNFINGIRMGERLHSPIDVLNVTNTSLLLANISWMVGQELKIDNQNGHITNSPDAMQHWSRQYQKGWEVTV